MPKYGPTWLSSAVDCLDGAASDLKRARNTGEINGGQLWNANQMLDKLRTYLIVLDEKNKQDLRAGSRKKRAGGNVSSALLVIPSISNDMEAHMIKKILAGVAVLAAGLSITTAASATKVPTSVRYIPPGEWRETQGDQYIVRADDDFDGSGYGYDTYLKSTGEHSFQIYEGKSWANWTAYPYIGRGCSWGICSSKNSGWPVQVGTAGYSNPYVSMWSTQNGVGSYNTSLDIWFNQDNAYGRSHLTDGASNGTEMMIWTNHPNLRENGINGVGGWNWPSVWIEGKEYQVMQWESSTDGVDRHYIAYVAVKQSGEFYGDLNPFFWNAEARGSLSSNYYWTSIDAGFELDGGGSGKGLGINYFSVDA